LTLSVSDVVGLVALASPDAGKADGAPAVPPTTVAAPAAAFMSKMWLNCSALMHREPRQSF
jgi:hypothetical protein